MQITRTSILTGITRTLEIDCTEDQLKSWMIGEDLIQNIMPNLTPNEREFIMTGVTEEEWESSFDDKPDDEYPDYIDPYSQW